MDVTRAKSFVPVTVLLPPLGMAKVSVMVLPPASLPVTVAVVSSQSAWLDSTSWRRREGDRGRYPSTPSSEAPERVWRLPGWRPWPRWRRRRRER